MSQQQVKESRIPATGAEEEKALLEKIAHQDDQALSLLYDRYARLLYSIVFSIVKKKEEAEDILQDVFLQVWTKALSFDSSKGNVYAWLVTMTRNKAIDRVRSKQFQTMKNASQETDTSTLSDSEQNTALDAVMLMERSSKIKDALNAIPQEQKETIQLAYYTGLTQTEISQKLNVPLGTVKTRVRQGMQKLRGLLKDKL